MKKFLTKYQIILILSMMAAMLAVVKWKYGN